jgi:hypothetical protein
MMKPNIRRAANEPPSASAALCVRSNLGAVIARSAVCDEAISLMKGIASLRPAKTIPDSARNDGPPRK